MIAETTVAALYVDPRGPYPGLVREWYDEARDASTYAGPWPVVAHPACGPWGRLRHLCTLQRRGDALDALAMVRRWGGVLEHPANSALWWSEGLPPPAGGPDAHGGFTLAVEQWWWGHRAVKPTWLYFCGLRTEIPAIPRPTGPRPVGGHARGPGDPNRSMTERLSKQERRRTPPAFASWLIRLAARCAR